jgi:Ca2+-transporting ATPase
MTEAGKSSLTAASLVAAGSDPPAAATAWHTLSAAEAVALLGSDAGAGLTSDEAAARLATHGANELKAAERGGVLKMFLGQFNDFMIWILMGAVALSAIEGQVPEAIAITAILLLNGVLGFVQEYRAERAMEALKQMAAPTAAVVRDGVELSVPAHELVPGDIVLLTSGDKIPADGRLLETAALRVEEASLTGESLPVHKHSEALADPSLTLGDRTDMVFAGTSVTIGRGRVLITSTGQGTEMGRIADLLAEQEEEHTPLQKELRVVGKRIAVGVLVVAGIVFVQGMLRVLTSPGGQGTWEKALTVNLLLAISLAVAAIPEGLPAIVTVSLSLGVRLMAQRNAIVRKLHAVETLGSTTFICTDKTGTLTRNEMVVRRMLVGTDRADILPDWALCPAENVPNHEDRELLLAIAASCNDARFGAEGRLVGDPTETALIVAADNLTEERIRPARVAEIPFDSERKRMTTVHELGGTRVAYVKGAPDIVLALCAQARVAGETVPVTPDLLTRLHAVNEEFASTGHRTLAFAMRELATDTALDEASVERDLTYVGILGMVDPPRAEVPAAIEACHKAGIHVAMVTGDHALTARAIGAEIGLLEGKRVVTGVELEAMSDDELYASVEDIRIYARVNPEHKLRIVDALKRHGHVVAMTGDGVNDAPALKKADIGVAMGMVGTDVSREAADMVLADDDFATIVTAIRFGRTVFGNIRKFILFLLSCNVSEVLIVFLGSFLIDKPVLLPLQLLWNNLITDGLPALALGVDPASPRVMDQPPRSADEGILTRSNQVQVLTQGALITAGALGVYVYGEWFMPNHSYQLGQTMLLTTMVLTQLLHAFSFRSTTRSIFSPESLRNRWLLLAAAGSFAAHLAVLYVPAIARIFKTVPLGVGEWGAVLVACLVPLLLIDAVKVISGRRQAA